MRGINVTETHELNKVDVIANLEDITTVSSDLFIMDSSASNIDPRGLTMSSIIVTILPAQIRDISVICVVDTSNPGQIKPTFST